MPPITPHEAIRQLQEPVVVEMTVRRTKRCTGTSRFFLDSEPDHHDPSNLGVVVTAAGAARFQAAGVEDLAGRFQGKTIRVRGTVTQKDGRAYLDVDDPDQIEVVGLATSSRRSIT